jgi:DNA polymerase-3 subunit delta
MPAPRRAAGESLKPAEVERVLAAREAAPVYLLLGVEAVHRDRALAALKKSLIAPGFELFNYRSLAPAGLDAEALAVEMRVLPMGGGRRLIVISPAEDLLKDQVKALGEYAADPSPATCLVLVAGELKETQRKAFAGAVTVDCSSPWEDRVPEHLAEEARSLKVKLDREAALTLASLCGRDLSRAVGELRKAAGRVGPGGIVTAAIVRTLCGGGEAADVYKVSSALARGDAAAAVRATRRLMETDGGAHLRVLYEIGMHLRRLLAARAALSSGASPRDAARAAGVFWKDADAFAAELPRWSEARIASAFRRLLEADRSVKRGLDDGPGAVEGCLWNAFGPPAARSGAETRAAEARR